MRIAVFGTGGVGGYFGGRLAQSGEEVIFLARGEHLQAIRRSGLRVDSINGNFTIQPAQAEADPAQVGVVDCVIVAVKTWQVPEAAEAMRPMVGPDTFIVPLENGVEAPGQLAGALGKEHVLGGLCQISTFIAGPGYIRHVGIEPSVTLGELDGSASPRVERLRAALERAGVQVKVSPDIQTSLWMKFLFIVAMSGVGGVTRAPVGVLRSLPETRQMLVDTMQEVYAVARARGVNLPEAAVANTMANVDKFQPDVKASMARDIEAGRPSELEAQNGAMARMGQEAAVPVPLNTYIYHSLLPQEKRARGEI